MDKAENNDTLSESFFLSSTTESYNGLLDTESSIDLELILSEFYSMLNQTIEDSYSLSEEFLSTRKDRQPSIIIAANNNDYSESEESEISQIRDTSFPNSIGGSVNRLSPSGMSFYMGKMENSICSGEFTLPENSNLMTHTGIKINWITDHLPKNDKNIENESCPTWNSLINMSFDDRKTNPNLTSVEPFKIPDTSILVANREDCEKEKTVIYDQSLNYKQDSSLITSFKSRISDSHFFTRRKKELYFQSPRKIINQTIAKEIADRSQEEEFERIIAELPDVTVADISHPEWPSFNDDDPEHEKKSLKFSRTSTINDLKTLPRENLGKSKFGLRVLNFFSRKKSTRYFNSPKK
ncbi:uncharacterized protein LOC117166970 [Belonocnema kinseyi]|uniref:uncharacterized protein LOC117166970 n=1 Tax=Belonocnema kinseyi TaxID=2817044 RepID=UPI00143D6F3C|nr:uncharacterized protein LOC117166970 [Belonocnema kinseyi]XP_033207366.1 uncharacterized protein LOC117166970 [Belonocnema kinseyi]